MPYTAEGLYAPRLESTGVALQGLASAFLLDKGDGLAALPVRPHALGPNTIDVFSCLGPTAFSALAIGNWILHGKGAGQ